MKRLARTTGRSARRLSVSERRRADRRVFVGGIALSMILHAFLLGSLTLDSLEWRAKGEARAPRAMVLPEFRAVELTAQRPAEPPRSEPIDASTAVPSLVAPALPIVEAPVVPSISPALIDVAMRPDSAATRSAPSASSPPTAESRSEYERQVSRWVERQRDYPLAARQRRLEGTAIVRIQVDGDGALLEARLVRDTGHAVLDRAALDMIRRAAPYPRVPQPLAASTIEVLVPIQFTLSR